ncbi:hypothetical protein LuPra_01934 [Luteitalea pratensis]|uniref:PEP-CTERM protein-sorting domain-containing protein n=1 Tax=Luteitalea pratensis TaxID=1855912 RepID=A0A143PKF5_LUTPR|nr:hypothetical protein [Luteitalea pratensis]AMY08730.1 hypothetical protein LuPra_01934 [Luteitalea pratensis]
MRVAQMWGRGAAVAFLLSVVSSATVAAPLQIREQTPASRGWLAQPAIDVPDSCAQRVIACRPGRFGELEQVRTLSLPETFAAQLVEALGPADVVELQVANPVAWALYTNAIDDVVGTHGRLALSVAAAAGPTPDATLLEDVAVLVQQVPEPSLLANVLIGLACWRRVSRRPST